MTNKQTSLFPLTKKEKFNYSWNAYKTLILDKVAKEQDNKPIEKKNK